MDTLTVTNTKIIPQVDTKQSISSPDDHYLSDNSPKDAKWDEWRSKVQHAEELLMQGDESDMLRFAERMQECTNYLLFALTADSAGELHHRLKKANFCRFRHCPVCQARRSRRNYVHFLKSLPALLEKNKTARWVFLTLTVPNIPIHELRAALKKMTIAWNRFIQLKEFRHVIGWVRSTEITKENNGRVGYAHPHFHVLMMVSSSYFNGKNYINRDDWLRAWQKSMRDESIVAVDVRIADRHKGAKLVDQALVKSISEVLKYSVKPSDMLQERDWLVELIRQVHKLRFLATGGLLKKIFVDKPETEDLIQVGENETSEMAEIMVVLVATVRETVCTKTKGGDLTRTGLVWYHCASVKKVPA